LFEVKRRGKWHAKARLLLEAYDVYESSLCGTCSQSSFHALDIANSRAYETDEATCLGCSVRASHEEQYNEAKKRPRGLKVFVVNRMSDPALAAFD